MSFTRIWVHAVWATKERKPFLKDKAIRYAMFDHIRENAKKKNIYIDNLNGWTDHCHATLSLSKDRSIKETIGLLKGESSHWINNKAKLLSPHFNWCKGYYAISVSDNKMPAVREYIFNQEEHHKKNSFIDECQKFMKVYGFDKMLGEKNLEY